jgi:hypothetical protein
MARFLSTSSLIFNDFLKQFCCNKRNLGITIQNEFYMKANKIFSPFFIAMIMIGMAISVQAQDAAKPEAGMTWKATTMDLGKIEQGKPVTVEFEFSNPSMVPLIINSVRPTCGCTVADYPKEPVAPGKTGKITLTYNAASLGTFTKSTTVTTNASEGNTSLVIKGEVVKK